MNICDIFQELGHPLVSVTISWPIRVQYPGHVTHSWPIRAQDQQQQRAALAGQARLTCISPAAGEKAARVSSQWEHSIHVMWSSSDQSEPSILTISQWEALSCSLRILCQDTFYWDSAEKIFQSQNYFTDDDLSLHWPVTLIIHDLRNIFRKLFHQRYYKNIWRTPAESKWPQCSICSSQKSAFIRLSLRWHKTLCKWWSISEPCEPWVLWRLVSIIVWSSSPEWEWGQWRILLFSSTQHGLQWETSL